MGLRYNNLILRTHAELDLLDQKAVADFFASEKPEYVFLSKKDAVPENDANRVADNLQKLNKNIIQISIFDWDSVELVKKILNGLIFEKTAKVSGAA